MDPNPNRVLSIIYSTYYSQPLCITTSKPLIFFEQAPNPILLLHPPNSFSHHQTYVFESQKTYTLSQFHFTITEVGCSTQSHMLQHHHYQYRWCFNQPFLKIKKNIWKHRLQPLVMWNTISPLILELMAPLPAARRGSRRVVNHVKGLLRCLKLWRNR